MIAVNEAENIIFKQKISLKTEVIPIKDAVGRVLAEDLCADRDFPPFDRVMMDGIAVAYDSFSDKSPMIAEGVAPAGKPQQMLQNLNHCLEVMTGAILPSNTDTVIRYEDLTIQNDKISINLSKNELNKGQNIHKKGSDRKKGEIIVNKGTIISPAEIGIAATIGKENVKVSSKIRAIVIATGDEIIPIDQNPLPHQIRMSNVYTLQAALLQWGVDAEIIHLQDNQKLIEDSIATFIQNYNLIILSGGVSAGKFDFVPKALENLGMEKLFHQVAQRPGKPFWFGRANENCLVFALPGNPVSTFLCLNRYVKPWLMQQYQQKNTQYWASLSEDFQFKPNLTFFLQVKLIFSTNGILIAQPIEGNGSGDLANLVEADAFLELPQKTDFFEKGQSYRVYPFKNIF